MHFHRDLLAICDTFSAPRPARRAATTSSPARRRSPSPSGSAALRAVPAARRRLDPAAREGDARTSCSPAIAQHRATVCFTAPTAYRAMLAPARRARRVVACASASRPASRCRRRPSTRGRRATGHRDHRRHRRDRDAAHLHRGAPRTRSGPARPASRCRATRRRSSTTKGATLPPGAVGRLAVRGPTGCRYLADERQRNYVAGRLEPHRRHLPAWTRTATSGTRRAPTT